MQLRELVLHDFRTYGDKQVIQLTTPSGKPIVLVGGLNGAGKTTILDALQLVLYGQRAKCASRGDLSYKEFLRRSIHRGAAPSDGARIELSFEHVAEGQTKEIRVQRSWYEAGSTVPERIEVLVDGVLDPVLTEQWDERVDDFAPHRISHLFFFDGEKIADLAEESGAADLMRTAIHALLGLDLVDRLMSDLSTLGRTERRGAKSEFDRSQVEQWEARSAELKSVVDERAAEAGETTRELDRARASLNGLMERYRREGGDLADSRVELERQLAAIQQRQVDLRDRLRELAHGPVSLMVMQERLQRLAQSVRGESETRRMAEFEELVHERDRRILEAFQALDSEASAVGELERILAAERGRVGSSESGIPWPPGLEHALRSLLDGELDQAGEGTAKLRAKIDALEEDRIHILRKLDSIPDEGALKELRAGRDHARELVERLEIRRAAIEQEAERSRSRHQQALEKLGRELEKELKAVTADDRIRKKLDRVELASETLDEFRDAILRRNLGKVEAAVLEAFQGLIRKPNLVQRISIDPETFRMSLIGPDGKPLGKEQLSAGESQLLAVSFLWGLARVAGLPLPVVIDTPLGRLDSKHRGKLVKNYFPNASHQVVLLSTDEEIEQARLKELRPYIGRSYILEYGPDEDRTVIREGYFWN